MDPKMDPKWTPKGPNRVSETGPFKKRPSGAPRAPSGDRNGAKMEPKRNKKRGKLSPEVARAWQRKIKRKRNTERKPAELHYLQ